MVAYDRNRKALTGAFLFLVTLFVSMFKKDGAFVLKQISVGLLLTDGAVFLTCHSTGNKFYDIPKGLPEPNETARMACIREVSEETGLDISAEELTDLGIFEYTRQKDLHLFLLNTNDLPATDKMVCSSFFSNRYTGKQQPEVDGFRYIAWPEAEQYLTKNMARVIQLTEKFLVKN